MRTYGRTTDEYGNKTWVVVETDANGDNTNVWLTTLVQLLKLNLGESPFFANLGIPQYQTILTQVLPTYYVTSIQQYAAPNFASLSFTQVPNAFPPQYNVIANCVNGATINQIPT